MTTRLKTLTDFIPPKRLSRTLTLMFLNLLEHDKEFLLDEFNEHLPADLGGLLLFLYELEDLNDNQNV